MDEQNQQQAGGAGQQATAAMNSLEAMLAPFFAKFPHLPENGRQAVVNVSPWIALIFGALGILSLLGVGGLGFGALTMMGYGGFGLSILIHLAITLLSSVLLLMAYPGLKAKTKAGWNRAFYSEVVGVVGGVVGIAFWGAGGIVGVVISALIGFWLLFEIHSYYK
jgi:hypothetical protein